jgi:rhomboid protease GluP
MWFLWHAGRLVERLVGNAGFLILYLLSGVAGSLASVFWNSEAISAGASGAIFGVFGALISFVLIHSRSLPKQMLGPLRNSSVAFLGYNLVFGLTIKWIDMAAHTGGLVAGFACGAIMGQPLQTATMVRRSWRNVLALALGGLAFPVAVHFAPATIGDQLMRFSEVEQQAIESYNSAADRARRGQLDDAQFASVIESDVLAPWSQFRKELDQVTEVPAKRKRFFETLKKYMRAREDAWETLVAAKRDADPAKMFEYQRKHQAAESLAKELTSLNK